MDLEEAKKVGAIAPNSIVNADCLEAMKGMADNSIDLILTDPPYFKVKKDWWDNQWDNPKHFIEWIDKLSQEWQRILRPNGSLYCFASPKMAARVEVKLGDRFNICNNIRWVKDAGWHHKANKEEARQFQNPSESIIFCEHYGADNFAKGEAGYGAKCDELRGFVFEPLRAYLDGERLRAGVGQRFIIEKVLLLTGHDSHYFSSVQWKIPTQDHYTKLQQAFTGYFLRPYEELRQEYEELRQEYEELRQEYEELRRPFSVTADVPYTDVWSFPTVQYYEGKHPCEKPLALLEHIIKASSREGATVLDCFAGSGSTLLAAKRLNRNYIGIEIDRAWVEYVELRLSQDNILDFIIKKPKVKAEAEGQLVLF